MLGQKFLSSLIYFLNKILQAKPHIQNELSRTFIEFSKNE